MTWQKADFRVLRNLSASSLDYSFTAWAESNPAIKLRSLLDEVVIGIVLTARGAESVIDVHRRSRFEFRRRRGRGLRHSGIADVRII